AARVSGARVVHDAGTVADLGRVDGGGDRAVEDGDAVHGGGGVGLAGIRERGRERRRPAESAGRVGAGADGREPGHVAGAAAEGGVWVYAADGPDGESRAQHVSTGRDPERERVGVAGMAGV